MQHHIQELIDELDSRGFDWSTNQLTVKENQAIIATDNAALIIDYTVAKNEDNTKHKAIPKTTFMIIPNVKSLFFSKVFTTNSTTCLT